MPPKSAKTKQVYQNAPYKTAAPLHDRNSYNKINVKNRSASNDNLQAKYSCETRTIAAVQQQEQTEQETTDLNKITETKTKVKIVRNQYF